MDNNFNVQQVKDAAKAGSPTFVAAVAYVLFFIPFLMGKQHDSFVRYHMNQAFGLFLFGFLMQGFLTVISLWASLLGIYTLGFFLVWAARIVYVVLGLYGVKNAWSNTQAELPWIGKYFPQVF
ncbi:MAG: hypothetical protein HYT30_01885 [Parcubacteria group bacterium]|nr:hypothetical protein [Parcubacteria group bacterium]